MTTSPSGLVVVHNQLTPVRNGAGLIVATGPLAGAAALDAARAGYAELTAAHGAPVADIVLQHEVQVAEQVRADEVHDQLIAAIRAGNLAGAVDLAAQPK